MYRYLRILAECHMTIWHSTNMAPSKMFVMIETAGTIVPDFSYLACWITKRRTMSNSVEYIYRVVASLYSSTNYYNKKYHLSIQKIRLFEPLHPLCDGNKSIRTA